MSSEVVAKIQNARKHSMCSEDALWTLYGLVAEFSAPISACEVGSACGGSALAIAAAMELKGGGRLICIDDYIRMAGASGTWEADRGMEAKFRENLGSYLATTFPLSPLSVYLDMAGSPKAASFISDQSLDFLFIDGDHTREGVICDINAFLPKMKSRSTMCGHDWQGEIGVRRAVEEIFGNDLLVLDGDVWVHKNGF